MKAKNALALQKGETVNHKRYGHSTVDEVIRSGMDLFGVVIIPDTEQGKKQLCADSGTDIVRFLEDSPRQIVEVAN